MPGKRSEQEQHGWAPFSPVRTHPDDCVGFECPGRGRLPNAAVSGGIGGGIGFIAPPLASGAANAVGYMADKLRALLNDANTKGMTQEMRDRIEQIVTILIQGARRPAIESAIDRE